MSTQLVVSFEVFGGGDSRQPPVGVITKGVRDGREQPIGGASRGKWTDEGRVSVNLSIAGLVKALE